MEPLIYILNLIYMMVLLCTSLYPQVLILLNISQPVVSRSPQGMSNDNTACTCYFASILISSIYGKRYHWQVQEGDSKVHGLNISVFPLRRWNHPQVFLNSCLWHFTGRLQSIIPRKQDPALKI